MTYQEPISGRRQYFHERLRDSSTEGTAPGQLVDPTEENPANVVSSLCATGEHRPAIDVDVPVRLIPSSTEDHWHLYFPTISLTWEQYEVLLEALVKVGIVQENYLKHSRERKQTLLRLPHVKKERASKEEAA